jgi:ATP-dependent helicase HrpA
LPSVLPGDLDWAVPAILRDKIYGLLRGLAKEYRKKLPPLSDLRDLMMAEMDRGKCSLPTAMARFIHDRFGLLIPAPAWSTDQLPDHLKMRMVVVDEKEQVLAASRNILDIRQDILVEEKSKAFEEARRSWEKRGLTAWTFGDLPGSVILKHAGTVIGLAYPALEIDKDAVHLSLFKTPADARRAHPAGVGRLYEILFSDDLRHLRKSLALTGKCRDWAAAFGGVKTLEKMLYDKVVHDLMAINIRGKKEFDAHGDLVRKRILPRGQEVLRMAAPVVKAGYEACCLLDRLEKANMKNIYARRFMADMRREFAQLLPATFLRTHDEDRLIDVMRYLRALVIRTERGLLHVDKALGKTAEVRGYEEKLKTLRDGIDDFTSADKIKAIDDLRWMIEEFKVSLFAQELKTPYPVSKKRLDERIREIEMSE